MQYMLVCNTASDSLSMIDLVNFKVLNYPLDLGEKPVGPHKMVRYNDKIIMSNSYNNSISILSSNDMSEISKIYTGTYPTDFEIFGDKAYVVCGESDSISVVDLITEELVSSMSVGMYPYDIEIDRDKRTAFVSNMMSNSISIIDLDEDLVIGNIRTYENPTKIFLSKDKELLYVCESNLEKDTGGYISIISTENKHVLRRIEAGRIPIDFIIDGSNLYSSNFGEGSISIINLKDEKEIDRFYVGGMPKTIDKRNNDIFICDYLNGRVSKIDLREKIIKNITVGKEPNAMLFIDYPL